VRASSKVILGYQTRLGKASWQESEAEARALLYGKPQYEFMPGSLMYALMLEFYGRTSKEGFTAMLPLIFPPLKEVYQKANPGVKL